MAHSSRRSRRLKAEANQQLISFVVRGEQFAVPVGIVEKVVTVDHIYSGPDPKRPGLALYGDQQISVIDLGQRLFTTDLPHLLEGVAAPEPSQTPRYLLVLPSPTRELVGLLVETQPALLRVPTSAFSPVPATYLHDGHIRYIGAVVGLQAQPVFLINVGELLLPQHASFSGDRRSDSRSISAGADVPSLDAAPADLESHRLLAAPAETQSDRRRLFASGDRSE